MSWSRLCKDNLLMLINIWVIQTMQHSHLCHKAGNVKTIGKFCIVGNAVEQQAVAGLERCLLVTLHPCS